MVIGTGLFIMFIIAAGFLRVMLFFMLQYLGRGSMGNNHILAMTKSAKVGREYGQQE
jgi:hypothetical protein